MGFFSLNRITGHPVNSSQFDELPHPLATTQGQADKNGNWPRASCVEQGVKVQRTVFSHQRHFHPRAGLKASLRLWKVWTLQLPAYNLTVGQYSGQSQ